MLGEELPVGRTNIESKLADCDPIFTNAEAQKYVSVAGTELNGTAAAYPCGLVAKSVFNDTFDLYSAEPDETHLDDNKLDIDDSDIAWKADVENKFFNIGKGEDASWREQ